jgi:hypothetical protein
MVESFGGRCALPGKTFLNHAREFCIHRSSALTMFKYHHWATKMYVRLSTSS